MSEKVSLADLKIDKIVDITVYDKSGQKILFMDGPFLPIGEEDGRIVIKPEVDELGAEEK